MRYQAVLFDMDGTVLDTLDDLCDSINHSLSEFSLPPVSGEHVRQCLGNGAAYLVKHSVPANCGAALEEKVLAFYKPWYDAHCLIRTAPYDGILPMMQALRAQGYPASWNTRHSWLLHVFWQSLHPCPKPVRRP